ncbi:glycosyltransferase family 4 protein [Cellulomonas composti]|uniref:Glycosyl transferase family 1 domain-containing protein n=1 Tax=Cellulomonas composti TaxID=266130 RepID=A0A511JB11_9CELL|nr:glycosyltransferase family 4 protein [Cellulomonas composti]GEL95168.1 hypothetical protein CCO02nite_18260 [Cellulomonas composti]
MLRAAGGAVTSRRHRLPAALDNAIERLKWARTPWTADPATLPPVVSRRTGRPARVLVAPANFAGQGHAWVEALERAGVPAVSWAFTADDRFGFGADHVLRLADAHRASRAYQRRVFDLVASNVEAVVIEAGRPLFGRLHGFDPVAEARALAERGVRVALLWHGTDVRVPSAHAATHPASPFSPPTARTRALESVALRNRRRARGFTGPVLVSTPDLLPGWPGARWCPVVVDAARWACDDPPLVRAVPVVVHAPSNGGLKGTDLVTAALEPLAAAAVVEYRVVSGVPSDEVRALYRDADVVLDQFRLGIYGVAACEAMAAGRLVVSNVDAQVRDAVRAAAGVDLPVLEASGADLAAVLRGVLDDRDRARALAGSGPALVAALHDGRRSAAVLADALGLGLEPID